MLRPGVDLFSAMQARRSIRRFTETPVPDAAVRKALQMAVLAPNSSNTQTWDFYWVRSTEQKAALVKACLSQSAARTAQELIVIVASPKAWRRSQPHLLRWVTEVGAPKPVIDYYQKLIPFVYRWGPLGAFGLVKKAGIAVTGLFRAVPRGPFTRRDVQEVAIKSAALAAENFVLAMTAQGFATCMMEGFDEARVKRLLGLSWSQRVVMVIGAGEAAEKGTWGPQYRLPLEMVVHEV